MVSVNNYLMYFQEQLREFYFHNLSLEYFILAFSRLV